jgi:hypothetical protein
MRDRFLDGYQHAGDGAKAMAIGNVIGSLPNVGKAMHFLENGVGAIQAAKVGFTGAASIMGRAAVGGALAEALLASYALDGAQQIGKILAGLGNMYFDAY